MWVSEKCSSLDSFESPLPRETKSLLYIHSLVHRIAYICFKCTFGPNPRELINFTLCREVHFAKFFVYFFPLISILYITAQKRICLSHIACLDRYDEARVLYFLLIHIIKCGLWTYMCRAKWIVHDSNDFRSSVQIPQIIIDREWSIIYAKVTAVHWLRCNYITYFLNCITKLLIWC